MNDPSISNCYYNHFLRYAEEQGVDVKAAPSPSDFGPGESYTPFQALENLVGYLRQQGCPPSLGLGVGSEIKISSHGSLGFALSNSENLDQCLSFISDYYRTRAQILDISYEKNGTQAFVIVRPEVDWGEIEVVTYDTVMALLYNILSFAIGKKAESCAIEYPYPEPAWSHLYQHHMPAARHVFGCKKARFAIPVELTSMPCVASDPAFVEVATGQLDLQLSRVLQQQPVSTKIRSLVEKTQNYKFSLEDAARRLLMSKSTLIRKLSVEGQTFRSLMEDLKKSQACYLLRKTNYKLDAVSVALGYDEVANFNRAFKRWFNCTPGNFRKRGLNSLVGS